MGINGYIQGKDAEKQEDYWRSKTIWGGPAFGGQSSGLNLLKPRASGDSTAFNQSRFQPIQTQQQKVQQQQQQQGLLNQQMPAELSNPAVQQYMAQEAQRTTQQPPPTQQTEQPRPQGYVSPELLGV